MALENDHVDLQVLARCYRQRSALPGLICLEPGRNVTPTAHLEALATTGKGPCPEAVVELLGLDHHVSVSTAARVLLDRLRSTGQLPAASTMAPAAVNARDDVEGLATLARLYRAERPVPHQVRIGGGRIDTAAFLEGFTHDRRECPASIGSDSGVLNHPASMREVATALLGRLRQAGQLPQAGAR